MVNKSEKKLKKVDRNGINEMKCKAEERRMKADTFLMVI